MNSIIFSSLLFGVFMTSAYSKCWPPIECPDDKHIEWAGYGTACKCVCNNFGLVKCASPFYYDEHTCDCECPWWGYLKCTKKQYFDPKTCSCLCKEPCKDCREPQIWSNEACECRCPFYKSCAKNRFWDDWDCRCNCNQKPRACCPELNKIWSNSACGCVCKVISHCPAGMTWDAYYCKCVWAVKSYQPINVADSRVVDSVIIPEFEDAPTDVIE